VLSLSLWSDFGTHISFLCLRILSSCLSDSVPISLSRPLSASGCWMMTCAMDVVLQINLQRYVDVRNIGVFGFLGRSAVPWRVSCPQYSHASFSAILFAPTNIQSFPSDAIQVLSLISYLSLSAELFSGEGRTR